jgi:hypothetical protein
VKCQYEPKKRIQNMILKEEQYEIVLGVHRNRNDASRENPVGAKKRVRLVRWLVDGVITRNSVCKLTALSTCSNTALAMLVGIQTMLSTLPCKPSPPISSFFASSYN